MSMWNPYNGYPPPFFPMQMGRNGLTLEDIVEARKAYEELEKSFKEKEEKSKAKKHTPIKFDILQTTGIFMILSFPVVFTQMWLLELVKEALKVQFGTH